MSQTVNTTTEFSANAFIELALARGVLKFGEFTLKSGRVSPYFFNAGLLNDGEALSMLSAGYAEALMQAKDINMIFGAAYKGIPFVASTAQMLWQAHGINMPWGFNRKEAKAHGEGGNMVGYPVAGQNVWVLDDVITAGTAMREVIAMLKDAGANVCGVLIALDRKEKGQSDTSAIQELAKSENIPVQALVTLDDVIQYLADKGETDTLEKMQAYRQQYGV